MPRANPPKGGVITPERGSGQARIHHQRDRIAAGASPNEIAFRTGHTLVSVVLDRYGHLLPGTEDRVNDALDGLVRASTPAQRAR